MDRVFDLEAAAPITSTTVPPIFRFWTVELNRIQSVYTHFTSDATAALAAPVTEVAFFTVPNGAREDAKTLIENDAIDNTHPVITVGKSLGGAVGWGTFGSGRTPLSNCFFFKKFSPMCSVSYEARRRCGFRREVNCSAWCLWIC